MKAETELKVEIVFVVKKFAKAGIVVVWICAIVVCWSLRIYFD